MVYPSCFEFNFFLNFKEVEEMPDLPFLSRRCPQSWPNLRYFSGHSPGECKNHRKEFQSEQSNSSLDSSREPSELKSQVFSSIHLVLCVVCVYTVYLMCCKSSGEQLAGRMVGNLTDFSTTHSVFTSTDILPEIVVTSLCLLQIYHTT